MTLVYVVLDSQSHIYGVRSTPESAETLRSQAEETLEYSGSRLKPRIDIQELKNENIPTFNDLEVAFEDGRKYEAGELELNTEGRNTAFEVWFENKYPKK